MPDREKMLQERKTKSLLRYAIENLVKRAATIAGDDIEGRKVIHTAEALIGQLDQVYEICSRAGQMLDQMSKGSWPVEELPGVNRAIIHAGTLMDFLTFDSALIACKKAVETLVSKGQGEKGDEDLLIDASAYLNQAIKAERCVGDVIRFMSEILPAQLEDKASAESFFRSCREKCREITKCLL